VVSASSAALGSRAGGQASGVGDDERVLRIKPGPDAADTHDFSPAGRDVVTAAVGRVSSQAAGTTNRESERAGGLPA
jgi:hypothetical protein